MRVGCNLTLQTTLNNNASNNNGCMAPEPDDELLVLLELLPVPVPELALLLELELELLLLLLLPVLFSARVRGSSATTDHTMFSSCAASVGVS